MEADNRMRVALRRGACGDSDGAFRDMLMMLYGARKVLAALVDECPRTYLRRRGQEAESTLRRLEGAFANAATMESRAAQVRQIEAGRLWRSGRTQT